MISSKLLRITTLIAPLTLILASCSDDAIVRKNTKELKTVHCMKLVIFPPDKTLENKIKKLYNFDKKCPYTLTLLQKSGIACNSPYNADKKTLSSFPSGYIRMELSKGDLNIFSYYKDLTHKADTDDVSDALEVLKKSLQ